MNCRKHEHDMYMTYDDEGGLFYCSKRIKKVVLQSHDDECIA